MLNYFCVIELMLKTSYKSDKIYLKTLRKKILNWIFMTNLLLVLLFLYQIYNNLKISKFK
jgi:hypothetical protein